MIPVLEWGGCEAPASRLSFRSRPPRASSPALYGSRLEIGDYSSSLGPRYGEPETRKIAKSAKSVIFSKNDEMQLNLVKCNKIGEVYEISNFLPKMT